MKCGQIFESKLSLDEHTNTKCTDIVYNDIKVDDFSVQSANINDAISEVTDDMKKTYQYAYSLKLFTGIDISCFIEGPSIF